MKKKKTYITKYQLKKYGFKIDHKSQTDLKCYRYIVGLGLIRVFNYDYYTIGPDSTLMIDIDKERVFEGSCRSRQRFQQIMKRLKINRIKSYDTTTRHY